MYNSMDSQVSARQGSRNVIRGGPQQNGVPYASGQQQWGVNDGQQFQQGGAQFQHGGSQFQQSGPQFQQGGPQFQQFPSRVDSYPHGDTGSGQFEIEEVKNSKEFGQLRTMFNKPVAQSSQSGVRRSARSSNRPVFRKSASLSGDGLDEMGWIPKNKPPAYSQNRYLPANMRSPPVNRKNLSDTSDHHQSSGTPAWQGTLRSAGGPRAWEIQDQPSGNPADQWSNGGRPQSGGGHRPRPSPPRDESGEPHSDRFYQLVNENRDQLEQYMKLPPRGSAYSGGNTSHGGHGSTVSYEAGNYQY